MTELPSNSPITFVVPSDEQQPLRASRDGAPVRHSLAGIGGRVKQSIRVSASGLRATTGQVRLTAVPGEDVVVLQIANGPSLVLHPETARDLLLAQHGAADGALRGKADADLPREVKVPAQLRWRGLDASSAVRARDRGGFDASGRTRGLFDGIPLDAIEVVTDVVKDKAADFAAAKLANLIDRQVDEGVYELGSDLLSSLKTGGAKLHAVPAAPPGEPLLVLLHGTFVDTSATFAKLWSQHPDAVSKLFKHYAKRVYALDHCTLGKSPIANALLLARAMPEGAKLHLLTHSRGGLVGEVLARVCSRRELTRDDLEPFEAAGYEAQRDDLLALAKVAREKDLTVERMLRVACPARGTLLASKRLDAYVSVLKWALELAGVPFVPDLIEFLGEVASRRTDPALLPGLAAMIPDSPLLQWLHSGDDAIKSDLRVVAGDIEGDSVVSWVKTLLADAFFWTDNDLVVQTRSMYGGAARGAAGASFLLDAGGKVTHFNYFGNKRTVDAVVDGLTQHTPKDFRAIGPLSWAGEDAGGTRAARPTRASLKPANAMPAVFVLPGILGSHLKVGGERVWLCWRIVGGFDRLAYTDESDNVAPDSPIGMFYDDLIDFLSETHEVIPFAFDWRKPIEEEARRLGKAVDDAWKAREATEQPVRLLAHSMGGILARAMMLECAGVWNKVTAHAGARLVMLGTPNAGSWAPMQVLSGDDDFGNTLALVGAPMQNRKARQLMASMPGFLQLQAELRNKTLGLDNETTWKQLAEDDLALIRMASSWHSDRLQLSAYDWGIPPQSVLNRAVALRTRLDSQANDPNFGRQLALVVGRATFTPDGYKLSREGLDYRDAIDGGDGRVTLASALLPGVPTWTLDCSHGDLPKARQAFNAFLELLTSGDTNRLPKLGANRSGQAAAVDGAVFTHVRSRPARDVAPRLTPMQSLAAALEPTASIEDTAPPAQQAVALRITVLNGNLKFVRQPLLIGHYRSLILTGAERVVDKLLGGTMTESLQLRRYPHRPGSSEVFIHRRRDSNDPNLVPRPEGVIVVGLGEEGMLRSSDLSFSVCQGVIAWMKRGLESAKAPPTHIELAATLIGSGGAGISAGVSARAIAQGIRDANESLAALRWPVVSHLVLVELYGNRATEAWQAVQLQASAAPSHFQVTPEIKAGTGPLERPLDLDYRGADYDFIRASWLKDGEHDGKIEYTVATRRARSELQVRSAQGKLLAAFVTSASNAANRDEQVGRTLFQLLIPLEMQALLGGTDQVVLELDPKTAAIPWELLDAPDNFGDRSDRRPWAIRTRLLRKLRTGAFRRDVIDASARDDILIIGDPLCDDRTRYPSLQGAYAETQAVARQFAAHDGFGGERMHALPRNANMRTVINALFARPYRIVHIAGHGEAGDRGGVVLSGDAFLGPREIENMAVVPQLVFVNCCHLAARGFDAPSNPYDRAAFAASVATALINIGVRCVIAAGWAVDDDAAAVFATTFYDHLLQNRKFLEAVHEAREAARKVGGNTWAAYQCYGDPDWTYHTTTSQVPISDPTIAQKTSDMAFAHKTYSTIASAHQLASALEALTVESRFDGKYAGEQRDKLRYLEERFASKWGNLGRIAEAFALAYTNDGATEDGIRWYERALSARDGGASLRAQEQLLNLRARDAWDELGRARSAGHADDAIRAAREAIRDALTELDTLAKSRNTSEALSLCGSACKRLALLENEAADARAETDAIAQMAAYYSEAESIASKTDASDLFYPGLNRMAAELVTNAKNDAWKGFDPDRTARIRECLLAKTRDDPDFWSVVGLTELRLYEALAERKLASSAATIRDEYEDLNRRVSSPPMWKSVRNQLEFVLPKMKARSNEDDCAIDGVLGLLTLFAASRA